MDTGEDMMPVQGGEPVHVPGWDDLKEQKNTLAFTLQALVQLERDYIYRGGPIPTQMEILRKAIELGAGLSPKSQRIIHANIDKLVELRHVRRPPNYEKRSRGGPVASWHSVYTVRMR